MGTGMPKALCARPSLAAGWAAVSLLSMWRGYVLC